MALTDQQRRFAEEYLIDLNAMQAAIRAGYTPKNAQANAHKLLADPAISALIAEAQAARSARTEITQDMVLQRWWDVATADPNELVQFRRTCCRHCWGEGHAYQWTAVEFTRACAKARQAKQPEPEPEGGLDFDRTRPPHPACPECRGEGVGSVHVADTRQVKGPARLLYAGVKEGKDGLEVKLQDQAKALEQVARHLGMFKDKGDTPVALTFNISSDDAAL
jgi:phage terminase small subunit